jgi:hypothetical protein
MQLSGTVYARASKLFMFNQAALSGDWLLQLAAAATVAGSESTAGIADSGCVLHSTH